MATRSMPHGRSRLHWTSLKESDDLIEVVIMRNHGRPSSVVTDRRRGDGSYTVGDGGRASASGGRSARLGFQSPFARCRVNPARALERGEHADAIFGEFALQGAIKRS